MRCRAWRGGCHRLETAVAEDLPALRAGNVCSTRARTLRCEECVALSTPGFRLTGFATVRDGQAGAPLTAVRDDGGVVDCILGAGQFPRLAVVVAAGQWPSQGDDKSGTGTCTWCACWSSCTARPPARAVLCIVIVAGPQSSGWCRLPCGWFQLRVPMAASSATAGAEGDQPGPASHPGGCPGSWLRWRCPVRPPVSEWKSAVAVAPFTCSPVTSRLGPGMGITCSARFSRWMRTP